MIGVLADVAIRSPPSTAEVVLEVLTLSTAYFLFGWAQLAVGAWLLKGKELRTAPPWLIVGTGPILSGLLALGAVFLVGAVLKMGGTDAKLNQWVGLGVLLAIGACAVVFPVWIRVWWSARPRG